MGDDRIWPELDTNGVPMCSERCPSFDGKRCEILGRRPDAICAPGVERMAAFCRENEGRRFWTDTDTDIDTGFRNEIRRLTGLLATAERDRDEARGIAHVFAFAYDNDTRPVPSHLELARTWTVQFIHGEPG